jgi:hypothetical protein
LYGRKINNAENQFAFIRFLRLVADGAVSPEEAVRAYHAVLERLGVKPQRSLEADMQLQTGVMSYGGTSVASIPGLAPNGKPLEKKSCGCGCNGDPAKKSCKPKSDGPPNFAKMTSEERLNYHRQRIAKRLGW